MKKSLTTSLLCICLLIVMGACGTDKSYGQEAAHAAFEKTQQAKEGKKINGLIPEQRFFMAFAQVRRIKNTPERLQYRIDNDPHSPERFCVEGPTSNMEAFYKAINVKSSDNMYHPDSVRVQIIS